MVGRFFREQIAKTRSKTFCLNPHVVGRFFRDATETVLKSTANVLILMWWGGFSEAAIKKNLDAETES